MMLNGAHPEPVDSDNEEDVEYVEPHASLVGLFFKRIFTVPRICCLVALAAMLVFLEPRHAVKKSLKYKNPVPPASLAKNEESQFGWKPLLAFWKQGDAGKGNDPVDLRSKPSAAGAFAGDLRAKLLAEEKPITHVLLEDWGRDSKLEDPTTATAPAIDGSGNVLRNILAACDGITAGSTEEEKHKRIISCKQMMLLTELRDGLGTPKLHKQVEIALDKLAEQQQEKNQQYVLVFFGILGLIVLCVEGKQSEAVLVFMALAFHDLEIITANDIFEGLMKPATILFGSLFVISAAFAETRVLEKLLSGVIGSPQSFTAIIVRLFLPVMVLSGVCANGPVCSMAMPLVAVAAEKAGFDPRNFYLPLAYATSLGGLLTLIGSPPNMQIMNGMPTAKCADFMVNKIEKYRGLDKV